MSGWTRNKAFPHAIRQRVLARDRMCVACGERRSTIADHIVPVAEGGKDTLANGQGMCSSCHDQKTARERQRGIERYNARRPRQSRPAERHPGYLFD